LEKYHIPKSEQQLRARLVKRSKSSTLDMDQVHNTKHNKAHIDISISQNNAAQAKNMQKNMDEIGMIGEVHNNCDQQRETPMKQRTSIPSPNYQRRAKQFKGAGHSGQSDIREVQSCGTLHPSWTRWETQLQWLQSQEITCTYKRLCNNWTKNRSSRPR